MRRLQITLNLCLPQVLATQASSKAAVQLLPKMELALVSVMLKFPQALYLAVKSMAILMVKKMELSAVSLMGKLMAVGRNLYLTAHYLFQLQ